MKNLKKMLALVLVLSAICVCFAVAAFAEDEYTGTVEKFTELVSKYDTAKSEYSKIVAVTDAADYLAATPVDPAAEGYADAYAKLQGDALALLESIDAKIATETVESTARNQVNINNVKLLISLGVIDAEAESYKAIVASLPAKEALQAVAKEANRQAMLAAGPLGDYSLATLINTNFDDGANPFPMRGNQGANKIDVLDSRLTIKYGYTGVKTNTYVQYTFPKTTGDDATSKKGIVVDFDYTTFGVQPGIDGFHLEGGSHAGIGNASGWSGEKMPDGSPKIYASYFRISSDGNICEGDGGGALAAVLLPNAITRGQWLHLTIIYDPVEFTYSVYAEYELLGTYSGKRNGLTYTLSAIRFAGADSGKTQFSIDNIQVYQGTALRELGMFERMNIHENFIYHANYYVNEASKDIIGRYNAYKLVTAALSTYVDADGNFIPFDNGLQLPEDEYQALLAKTEEAVAKVTAFDDTQFLLDLAKANTTTFSEYVAELEAIPRLLTEENISRRGLAVTKIEDFIKAIEGNIERNAEYDAAFAKYAALSNQRFVDQNVLEFNKYMARYARVTVLTTLEKYYNLATSYLKNEAYPIDPAIAELPGFESFKEWYAVYLTAADRIDDVRRDSNSKKIITCLEIVKSYAPETWEENYAEINPYVIMIRDTIKENFYNLDYEGIDEAIKEFEQVNAFFYGILQQRHIEELTVRLDYVYNNDAYIEKMGTLSYIQRYIDSNDVDRTNPEIAKLIANFETALEELSFREVDYETVLRQNAAYFVSLVEKMRISDGFNDKKALYDEATGYYFALDANVEGAKEAIAIFDEHTLWFEKVDESSNLFLNAVVVLRGALTEDEKYAALVDCYVYSLDAEITYDGVSEAMEYFTAQYNEYNGYASSVNEVVAGVGVTIASVRANCGVDNVIAVIIKKIFD